MSRHAVVEASPSFGLLSHFSSGTGTAYNSKQSYTIFDGASARICRISISSSPHAARAGDNWNCLAAPRGEIGEHATHTLFSLASPTYSQHFTRCIFPGHDTGRRGLLTGAGVSPNLWAPLGPRPSPVPRTRPSRARATHRPSPRHAPALLAFRGAQRSALTAWFGISKAMSSLSAN